MLYKRDILAKIEPWYFRPEIIIINGPRQVGKTSVLKLIREDILAQKKIPKENIYYFNLEDLDILTDFNQGPKELLKYLTVKDRAYVFIDEIQYLDNPSCFLKYLYDEHRERIKLFVTGSSSLEIKARLQDSLVGRKQIFQLSPLSFAEFLRFKKNPLEKYWQKDDLPLAVKKEFIILLNEYLIFGGMPQVVLTQDAAIKEGLLRDYVNFYITKDIRSIAKINDIFAFNQLVKILSSQVGALINLSELTNTISQSRSELKKFLDVLEQTFVIVRLHPWFSNIRSQITKMSKIYFFDIGLRNAVLANFLPMENRTDSGALFENFILNELLNIYEKTQTFFFRTTSKTEIDFIISKRGQAVPLEAKYKSLSEPSEDRGLIYFLSNQKNAASQAYLVNLSLDINKSFGQKKVNYSNFISFISRIIKDI